ncbi:MAG: cupin domain-containing protein, partial [Eubacteriales bacterium]|nr:cupin domain-containing protein [Eubacteriales bacterium]
MNEFYFFQDMSFSDAAPVQYVLSSIEDTWAHWHKEIEILFLLSGELQLTVDNTKYNLKTGDIILINSNQIHSINGNNDLAYILQFVPEVISRVYGSEELYQFNLNTASLDLGKEAV